jgi:hypothetical protein
MLEEDAGTYRESGAMEFRVDFIGGKISGRRKEKNACRRARAARC